MTACSMTRLEECDIDPKIKGLCYAKYAIENNDPGICNDLTGQHKDKCLNAIAKVFKDKELCNGITDDEMKIACLEK